MWAFTMMLNWVPTYMHNVFGMSSNLIGLYNAFAYLGQFIAGFAASGLSDRMFAYGGMFAGVASL